MIIHPDCPFAHLYRIESTRIPEEVLCFLWYLCSIYTVGITFDIQWLYQYVNAQFTDPQLGHKDCLSTFLSWFAPLSVWSGKLRRSAKATGLSFKKLKGQGSLNPFFNPHTIYFFHRPVQVNNKTNKIHALPTLIHHNDYPRGVRPDFNLNDNKAYEDFQTHAFHLQFFMEKWENPIISEPPKAMKSEQQSEECPPEYFQDAQLRDDSMNIR
ncbi:hypothetical protein Bca52824_026709 [Brassica carinata]|uniref:Uncharacterized protein n=1 Tax=Brassica carinata TaxID=52824 RepID=A0A8X7VA07_BRACI|nr:hypothetical protein Bca52824_026709 [Brassica carinata]